MTTKKRALDVQEGGNHYKKMPIQPVEYCYHNKLGVCESNIIKYITRWRDKNGIQDLEKARHYIDLLIEFAQAEQVTESDWPSEECIENIGRNGNDGEVYERQPVRIKQFGTHLLKDEFGTYVVLSACGLDIFIRDREKLLEIASLLEQAAQKWEGEA